jgi:trk system potassium uptake protein TrkH
MSGFTTAGATILTEVDSQGYWILNHEIIETSLAYTLAGQVSNLLSIPFNDTSTIYGFLFWRSFTQFLGGMGIILLFLAILPNLGVSGRKLYQVEGLGLTKEALTPHVMKTAEIFWSIYFGLAAVEALILMKLGLPLYDAICTALTSLATGGFSPRALSIASYNSFFVDVVVCIFLVIGGTSFLLHYKIIFKRDLLAPLRDVEFRFYIFIMALSIIIILLWGGLGADLPTQLRYSIFQVASIMTTTGFVNNLSYDHWSLTAKFTLILLMLIGGCAGSTGGGIKVGRVLIILKYAYNELLHVIHPQIVTCLKMGDMVVSEDIIRSIQIYIILYLMIFLGASLTFTVTESGNSEFDAISAFQQQLALWA